MSLMSPFWSTVYSGSFFDSRHRNSIMHSSALAVGLAFSAKSFAHYRQSLLFIDYFRRQPRLSISLGRSGLLALVRLHGALLLGSLAPHRLTVSCAMPRRQSSSYLERATCVLYVYFHQSRLHTAVLYSTMACIYRVQMHLFNALLMS